MGIYFFRGIPATGKTALTDRISAATGIAVFRKDDIFDPLSDAITDISSINRVSYDILARCIQTNIAHQVDIMVDVGFADTQDYTNFLSKLDLRGAQLLSFLCICSNQQVWKKRIEARLLHPAPNQFYRSFDEAVALIKKKRVELLEGEICLDSAKEIEYLMKIVLGKMGRSALS